MQILWIIRLISMDVFTLHELECEQTRYNLQITHPPLKLAKQLSLGQDQIFQLFSSFDGDKLQRGWTSPQYLKCMQLKPENLS